MDSALLQKLQTARPRILVVGDIMLDRYTWGAVERVSPEAPVLILRADSEEVRLGGAASVAGLLRGLQAEVSVAGVLGADSGSAVVRKLFSEARIDVSLVREDLLRPTTVKERFLGRPEHRLPSQLLRVDHESRQPLDTGTESELLEAVVPKLGEYQAIVVSDYGKGVCTPLLLQSLITEARELGIPILVDPERREDFSKYQRASVLKPNRAAAALASKRPIRTVDEAFVAAERICGALDVSSVVITLDRDGMVWQHADGSRGRVECSASHLRDITGAGDMAHAILGFCLATQRSLEEAVELANLAAGLEVGRDGVEPITWDELLKSTLRPIQRDEKIVTLSQLEIFARQHRAMGKKIVLTNGCFDLLHVGHVSYLQQAAELGDVLIVAINADSTVRRLKGSERPIIGQHDRAAILAALGCVTHVLIFDEETPHVLLRRLRPDVLVKGGTYSRDEVIGREVVEEYGGQVRTCGLIQDVSTTGILQRARSGSVVDEVDS